MDKRKVRQLKADIASKKYTQPQLAEKYGVSRSYISDIACGRRYANVLPEGPDAELQELQAEVLHLKQERDEARKQVKLTTKEHGLFRAIVKEMEERITPIVPAAPVKQATRGKIEEHLVLHLSDGHHDQEVSLEESGYLEYYNFDVSCRRAETLIDTTINWSQHTLGATFQFPVLHVLAYGDHTSGEIHGAVNRSKYRNQFRNCLAIGQLHALMYHDLAPYFEHINVVYVPGNHGRRSAKKDFHGAQDNWDYLIAEVARLHCRDHKNIHFTIPNSFSVNLDINGIGFNVSHGDDVRSHQGIPWYGMQRRQKNLIALTQMQSGPPIRYTCMGHHHVQGSVADIQGELLLNGAWVGTDSYAYNSFAGYREPTQWLHGVNSKRGITWRLGIRLRTDDDHLGPKRYKIQL